MIDLKHIALGVAAVSLALVLVLHADAGADMGDAIDFQRDVRPVLSRNCFACHGPDDEHRAAGLRLDLEDVATAQRRGGRAIVPGDPAASLLVERVTTSDLDGRMPPADSGHALESDEIALLVRWIEEGAIYADHWSLVPPARAAMPDVSNPEWVRNPIDAFVLAELDRAGLTPAPEADRYALARRLALDLIGLPPSPEQAGAFASDQSDGAYERYVDRLLDDPAYGERWARVWLDLARYADSAGYGSDPLRTIWRWRDWVIEAYNANLPYDRFTELQMAGDLVPGASTEDRLATAFHRNSMTNTEGGTDDEEFRVAAVKDRVNTTMQVWMGLTAGCAQCHNHKYDPISQAEYYQLFDFFNHTADADRNDDSPRLRTPTAQEREEEAQLVAELDSVRASIVDPGHDVDAARAVWMSSARERESSWLTLVPRAARASEGSILAWTDDGVVSASGEPPDRDEYTIELDLGPGRFTGLALEAEADPALPGGGPGRSPGNGNFVLSELRLELAPDVREAPRARRVRLDLPGSGRILSLAEVQVFVRGKNVAPEGAATQSSVAYEGPPELAIDGETSGLFEDASVTHTATEDDPWWELDLGRNARVDSIALWNRTDGRLHERLDGVVISLLDKAGQSVWRTRLRRAPETSRTIAPAEHGREVELAQATADFSQNKWDVGRAIDGESGERNGWAIGPNVGAPHRAVFAFAAPLELAEPTRATVTLTQNFGTAHLLGRFRLAATEHDGAVRALPRDVATALSSAPHCSAEEEVLLVTYFRTVDPALAELRAEEARIAAAIDALDVATTPVLEELAPDRRRTSHVLLKGSFLDKGEVVEASTPDALHAFPADAPRDRLGLARWLTSGENPLTARVAANRLWAVLFGAGLVETEEDFGSQGALPTHPELLDWLAVELVENGWDQKALLRTIVTSATYRQSAQISDAKLERDPDGRLFSRGARYRLEAETVRDQALAVSGLLSRKMYGPSVFPPQPDGLWRAAFNGQRNWSTSAGEDRYRRALYVFWRRTIPYPSMEVFDAPSRETCTPRRIRTNTPLQAFVTLNDPVYVEAAQALARRVIDEAGRGARERARYALRLVLVRPPTVDEVELVVELLGDARAHFEAAQDEAVALAGEGPDARETAAWTVVGNVLLNLDEFLTRQ